MDPLSILAALDDDVNLADLHRLTRYFHAPSRSVRFKAANDDDVDVEEGSQSTGSTASDMEPE
jgi:hypothetical protein